MRERLHDAMAIFEKFGPMDAFITLTANPTWSEIICELAEGEQVSDRPDLVARVFKLDITKNIVLGFCVALLNFNNEVRLMLVY